MKQFLKKFLSVKLLVTVWCMVIVSYVVFKGESDLVGLVTPLSFAPLVYCGLNVAQKKIYADKEFRESQCQNDNTKTTTAEVNDR